MFFTKKRKAPELIEVESEKQWINSKPLKLADLAGKVVLLDFWAYSCVNCIRTLPALKRMWSKYRDKRFVIIGIHTPEFEFEKEVGNVKHAVKKHGLEYPVVSDPERYNWIRYGNRWWPRAALINAEGELVFDHVGEAGYDEIEERIIEELKKIREIKGEEEPRAEEKRKYESGISPETYVGSARNEEIGSSRVCTPDGCNEFIDNKEGEYERNVLYLQGTWKQEAEYGEFVGKEGWITFKFYASEVNLVMSGSGLAEVTLNGGPVPKSSAGRDIIFKGKKSYVRVDGSDMYSLVDTDDFREGVLKIIPFKEMKAYAYTFG